MGSGVKFPESERPAFHLIAKRLDDRVYAGFSKLFLNDIQNDCSCDVEIYDCDINRKALSLTSNGAEYIDNIGRINCPMLEDISSEMVSSLLEETSKLADDHFATNDIIAQVMIYSRATNPKLILETFTKYTGRDPHFNRSGIAYDMLAADFVPVDCVFFIPGPEYFGVISVNVERFGAFCFPSSMMKVKLQPDVVINARGNAQGISLT